MGAGRGKSSDLEESVSAPPPPPSKAPPPFHPHFAMQGGGQLSSTPLQMVTGPAGSCWGRERVHSSVTGRGGLCGTGMSRAGEPCSHLLMRQLVRQGPQPTASEGCGRDGGGGLRVFWKELPRQREYQDKGWGGGAWG